MKREIRFATAAVVGIGVIASSMLMTTAQADTTKASKNPYGSISIDPPAPGTPVLTLSKAGVVKNYSLAQLQTMASKSITIYEPFLKVKQTFSVISLATLFAKVGIKPTDKVITKALNDYIYTNTAANFLAANGQLAVKRGGVDIPYDQGGPDRIIFPNGSKWSKFLDPWNWSLSSISVK